MDYSVGAAFLVGLLSTLHCFGMCNGIIGTLTLSLPPETRNQPRRLLSFVLAYNVGRVASYTAAGALVGLASGGLFEFVSPRYGHNILQVMAAGIMASIGLYLAGWFPKFALIERAGRPLWRRLEPLAQGLLPVHTRSRATLFGALWGWLPCGLVYSMLLWAITAGSAAEGAALMLAFGLGTLPTVLLTGILINKVVKLARMPQVRKTAGVAIVAMALIGLATGTREGAHMPFHEGGSALQSGHLQQNTNRTVSGNSGDC